MQIEAPVRWESWIGRSAQTTRLLAHPGGTRLLQWPIWPSGGHVSLSIGPEGGFTEAEVEAALQLNWTLVDIAPTILRIETAALVGSALIINRARGETLS